MIKESKNSLRLIFLSYLTFLSFNINANNCDANAIMSVMSDKGMDQFRQKLCLHYFSNEFIPADLNNEICSNIVLGCQYEVNQYFTSEFKGKSEDEVINNSLFSFWESVNEVSFINDEYGNQLGNVEFFRAIESSFSKEEQETITSCPEMKAFSTLSECLSYEGIKNEDDAFLIQSYSNSAQMENLIKEMDALKYKLSSQDENLSEVKKDGLRLKIAEIQKKMDEKLMHNGLKNIDYEKNDPLYEALKPVASNLNGTFDGEASAIGYFINFLPGYNTKADDLIDRNMLTNVKKTDLILGYWWQMLSSQGKNPTGYLEDFFRKNKVNDSNLKDVLKKLRLQMARERADFACSEKSKLEQQKFNDKGGACSILIDNRKNARVKYFDYDEFEANNAKFSNQSPAVADSDSNIEKKKIIYNSKVANRLCTNRVNIYGPFLDRQEGRSSLSGETWEKAKKDIRGEIQKKESKVSSYLVNNFSNRKFDDDSTQLNKAIKGRSELRTDFKTNDSLKDSIAKTIKAEDDKLLSKNLSNAVLDNRFDANKNNFGINRNNVISNTNYFEPAINKTADKSKAELEIESRIRALDAQIDGSKKSKKEKDREEGNELEVGKTKLNELMAEKDKLREELEKISKSNLASKKDLAIDSRNIKTIPEEDSSTPNANSGDERLSRKSREYRPNNAISAPQSNMNSGGGEFDSGNNSESKAAIKSSGTTVRNDFGLTFSKGMESTNDLGQLISDPNESELIKLAEKSNGEPFLINENGVLLKVVVKKDNLGKLSFEKVKLTEAQKKKIITKKDIVRSVKEVESTPVRKMELDQLMRQR